MVPHGEGAERALTIATFNIRHGRGRDGAIDLTRTAAAIAATGADVVALQEVDRGMARSGRVDQPAILEDLTGMPVAFAPALTRGAGEYGIALCGRVGSWRARPLPRVGVEEPRVAVVAAAGGVAIVATHLSRDRLARSRQLDALAALVEDQEGPVVVAGDLNCPRRDLRPLLAAGVAFAARPPATRGRRAIDHIGVRSPAVLARLWTVTAQASDHVPLVALVSLRPSDTLVN